MFQTINKRLGVIGGGRNPSDFRSKANDVGVDFCIW